MAHGGITKEELSVLSPGEMLRKIFTDLYFGNGKPALLLRVQANEDELTVIQKTLEDHNQWQRKMTTLLIGTLISSVGGLIGVIVAIVLRH